MIFFSEVCFNFHSSFSIAIALVASFRHLLPSPWFPNFALWSPEGTAENSQVFQELLKNFKENTAASVKNHKEVVCFQNYTSTFLLIILYFYKAEFLVVAMTKSKSKCLVKIYMVHEKRKAVFYLILRFEKLCSTQHRC